MLYKFFFQEILKAGGGGAPRADTDDLAYAIINEPDLFIAFIDPLLNLTVPAAPEMQPYR